MRLFLLSFLLIVGLTQAGQVTYLSSGGTIRVYDLDAATGKLSQKQELPLAGAGPLRASHDGRFLYAVSASPVEGKKNLSPALASLKILPDGTLELIATNPVAKRSGYLGLDATGRYLAGNHYREGAITVWSIKDGVAQSDGRELMLEKKAHSAVFAPDNKWLLVPATGPNKVFVNRFDAASGVVTPNDPPFASGSEDLKTARQPRHLVFHPNNKFAFTTNERELAGVQAWKWDATKGTLTGLQSNVTEPKTYSGRVTTADLHLTPNGRFLFVSNRNLKPDSPEEDKSAIVSFAVDASTGALTRVAETPCESVPRSFCVDATGKFVYVAGQAADALGSYRIEADGKLTRVATYDVGKGPIWVTCHQLAD